MTLALVAALALLVFVLLGAVVELTRDVHQLREALGILERPTAIDVARIAGTSPSVYGLPTTLDREHLAVVLFLHEGCGSCRSLAAALGGRVPDRLWILMEARSDEIATQFLERFGLHPDQAPRVVVDAGQRVAELLGLDITPVALRIQNGTIVGASTVPSERYLRSLLPMSLRRKGDTRPEAQSILRGDRHERDQGRSAP